LARRLDTAGLQLAEVMMTRTRVVQRYTRVKFTLFAAHKKIYSFPAATASRRRGSELDTTNKYLRKTKSGAAGIGPGAPG
jgi:hypothetical protein